MTFIPSDYVVILKDAVGNVLCPKVDTYTNLTYSRAVNSVGQLTMTFIDKTPDTAQEGQISLFEKAFIDGRIEIMRSVQGGAHFLDWDTVYRIRKIERDLNAQSQMTFTVTAEDTIGLLNRETTSADATDATVNKTAVPADDMLKTIFGEQFGAGSALTNWSSLITTAPNLSAAQSIAQKFSNQVVLSAMQKIAQASTVAGTYLAFDIFADQTGAMQFRTYTGQRGTDRRASTNNGLIIGPDAGNVLSFHSDDDYTQSASYIIAGSQNAYDANLEIWSPFGRIVRRVTESPSNTTAQMLADAQSALRAARSKTLVTVEMIQTEGCQEGLHYKYGDYLTAGIYGKNYDCHLDAITRTISGGKDVVTCLLRSI